jgi:DNA-binding NarL/FixJ family response regulator
VHRTLTPQQRKIVRLLSLGCTVVEAGLILGIAASTVDNHKFRAMRLLGIRKIAILTRYAMLNGISNLEDCLTLEELERMRGSRR